MTFKIGDKVQLRNDLLDSTYEMMALDGFCRNKTYIVEKVRYVPYQYHPVWGECNPHCVLYLIGRPEPKDLHYYVDEKFEHTVGFVIE